MSNKDFCKLFCIVYETGNSGCALYYSDNVEECLELIEIYIDILKERIQRRAKAYKSEVIPYEFFVPKIDLPDGFYDIKSHENHIIDPILSHFGKDFSLYIVEVEDDYNLAELPRLDNHTFDDKVGIKKKVLDYRTTNCEINTNIKMILEENTEPSNFVEAFLCGRINSKERQMLQQLKSQIDFADQLNVSFFGGAEIERDIERRENIRENNFDYLYQEAIKRLNINLQNKYLQNTEFRERQKLYFSSVTIFNNEITILKWYLGIGKNVNLEEQKNKNAFEDTSRDQEIKEKFQDVYEEISEDLGREATHEDLVKDFIAAYGKAKTKELLSGLEKGTKLVGKQVTDTSHLFNVLSQEQINIQLLKGVLFEGNDDDQSILEISSTIFREGILQSNKDMTFEYITNPENIFNDSSLLDYAGLFRALRSTISQHTNNTSQKYINDRNKVALETYKTLLNSIIHSINKI